MRRNAPKIVALAGDQALVNGWLDTLPQDAGSEAGSTRKQCLVETIAQAHDVQHELEQPLL